MSKVPLPSHLSEIIEKGYSTTEYVDALKFDRGLSHIDKNGVEIKNGVGTTPKGAKVVAFCFDGPFLPIRNGASYSLFNLMNALGQSGEVFPILISCYRGDSPTKYKRQNFKTVFVHPNEYYNHGDAIKSVFVQNHVKVVQFCSSEGLLNLGPYTKELGIRVVFDVQNIDHILEERLQHSESRINAARTMQRKAVKASDYILCRSMVDLGHLTRLGTDAGYVGIYNGGINLDDFSFPAVRPGRKKLVFLAHMYYEPNENAFLYFVNDVMPRIDSEYTLTVIGNVPQGFINRYKNENRLVFKQGVDNLNVELHNYDVAVAPILEASGTRLKILDYLAVGLPVVATNIAVEGLLPGIESVVSMADDADSMACAIQKITDKPMDFYERAVEGRNYIAKYYDWKRQLAPFFTAYDVH